MGSSFQKHKLFIERPNGVDRRLSYYVVLFYLAQLFNTAIKTMFALGDSAWSMVSMAFMALLVVAMAFTIMPVIKQRGGSLFVVELLLVLIFGSSFLMGNAETGTLLNYAFWSIAVCTPIAFYVLCIKDKSVLLEVLLQSSYIVAIVMIPCALSIASSQGYTDYSMSYAMVSLPFCLVQIKEALEKRKAANILVSTFMFLFLFFFGNRGSIICIAFYVILKVTLEMQANAKNILGLFALLLATVFVLINASSILITLQSVFSSLDFDTYTIRRIIDGTWLESTGRDYLTDYYAQAIEESPIYGYGICGHWISSALYPHNGLTVLLLAFGVPIGGLMCAAFICSFIRMAYVHFKEKSSESEVVLIFGATCFTQLITATLGVTSPALYVFIATCWFGGAGDGRRFTSRDRSRYVPLAGNDGF